MWQYNETNYLSHARSHKYIARVKVNGKYRYFYSQAEYAAYLKQNRDKNDADDIEYNKQFQEKHKNDLFGTTEKWRTTDLKTGKTTTRIYKSTGKIEKTYNATKAAASEAAQKGADYVKKLLGK